MVSKRCWVIITSDSPSHFIAQRRLVVTNPYAPSESVDVSRATATQPSFARVFRKGLVTAAVTVGSMLTLWIFLVQILDRRFPLADNLLWTVTLWFSVLTSSFLVASSKHAYRPTLVCPLTFAAFSLLYILCEGPVFGDVAAGGDPSTTQTVVVNLISLPAGGFVASFLGSKFRTRVPT